MGFRDFVKNTVKDNTNVKGWSGWDIVKDNGKVVKSFANDLKNPHADVPPVAMTFEEAMKKYGLTEADLPKKMRAHLLAACTAWIFALVSFVWCFNLLFEDDMFLSSLVSLSLGILMSVYGFREHFFYFQMKKRKLNCTVKEWFLGFLGKR